MAMSWLNEFDDRLAALDAQSLRRVRRSVTPEPGARLSVDGVSLLAFCSNDYLGLAQDPLLRQAVHAAVDRYGVGSGASPMVSGHSVANAALERELAEAVGLPRALYFYAGYATNASIVPALVGEGDALFSDALNHACLIDGARLSKATVHRFPHGDLTRLDALLAASPARRKLVISDAVFSMDGDVADIAGLHALCERHDALLLLDDAHGFGVLGPHGRGALAAAGLTGPGASPRVLYMATLGKALGVAGAFVAGPERLVEWLLQKTRSYTYATAAPAPLGRGGGARVGGGGCPLSGRAPPPTAQAGVAATHLNPNLAGPPPPPGAGPPSLGGAAGGLAWGGLAPPPPPPPTPGAGARGGAAARAGPSTPRAGRSRTRTPPSSRW
ncbi:aminotransferase class I/II-fold pyridoxal phosphate-dependent enzyme [Hydrogenophaga aromaticivorans]|uniref:aminotransferase class I/II-fold pyridoxal phosphate-dependent enzyme n=1 Tax=Hydrogenophaga aromaticivorans TaxID=2610898 RepID=UPI001FE469EB|nr:8-amino-7-oxononanoate synthase [Hydrogenophaga aromaticivorans]